MKNRTTLTRKRLGTLIAGATLSILTQCEPNYTPQPNELAELKPYPTRTPDSLDALVDIDTSITYPQTRNTHRIRITPRTQELPKVPYAKEIYDIAEQWGINQASAFATIELESTFRHIDQATGKVLRSNANACSLTQLSPGLLQAYHSKNSEFGAYIREEAKRRGISLPGDPCKTAKANLTVGIGYLKFLTERYNGNERAVQVAYNWSLNAAQKIARGNIPELPEETRDHISKYRTAKRKYTEVFKENQAYFARNP